MLPISDQTPAGFKLKHTLSNASDVITRFAWSAEGGYLAAPCIDGIIYIWEAKSGCLLKRLADAGADYCLSLTWLPRQGWLAAG